MVTLQRFADKLITTIKIYMNHRTIESEEITALIPSLYT